MEKEECIQIMMIQDKIIAIQQECEEICQNKKPPLRGRGSGKLRFPADVEQRPEQTGKQAWAAVNYNLHTVTPPFGK